MIEFLKKNLIFDCFEIFKTMYRYNEAQEKKRHMCSGYLDGKNAN
jgi:hypothetical protein